MSTSEGQIEVKGTIFSVARADGELTVDVAEGVVEVASPNEPKASVRQGQRLKRVRKKAERFGLQEAEELRLLLAVRAIELDESAELEDELAAVDEVRQKKPRRVDRKKRRWKRRPLPREAPVFEPAPDPTPEIPRAEVAYEPPPATLDDLLSEAERLKRAGDMLGARRALRRAGEMPGPDARATWIALARLELQTGNTADVRRAVAEYRRRGGGPLEPEGSWILVRAEERAGRAEEARAEAAALLERWPSTPQAEEARRWIQRADAGASP